LEPESTGDELTLRLFVLLLFVMIFFVGAVSAYYIVANTNWGALDTNLAVTMRLFYVYSALLGACLLGALVWLVLDERRIRKLRQLLEKEKAGS
jgi:phage shock protein PspC (stress-responsive transcriptional regulator)